MSPAINTALREVLDDTLGEALARYIGRVREAGYDQAARKAVRAARDAFFGQPTFRRRGAWDRNLFDDDPDTFFAVSRRYRDVRVRGGAFRLDLGAPVAVDRLVLEAERIRIVELAHDEWDRIPEVLDEFAEYVLLGECLGPDHDGCAGRSAGAGIKDRRQACGNNGKRRGQRGKDAATITPGNGDFHPANESVEQ